MSYNSDNNTGYTSLTHTWIKQPKYSLSTNYKENFGSFSISAAVRPSSCNCNKSERISVYGVS